MAAAKQRNGQKPTRTATPKSRLRPKRGQQLLAFVAEADARRRKARRAARKRSAERRELLRLGLARVPHRRRPTFERTMPVHVTMRLDPDFPTLRNRPLFRLFEQAVAEARERFGTRLTHFSVQDSHLHLIAEAENSSALSRAMQGLKIRIAKGLNAYLNRSGAVFSDRFHVHVLRTPAEVRNAVNYVLKNAHKHLRQLGYPVGDDEVDPYAAGPDQRATAGVLERILAAPRTWLLTIGWRRSRSAAPT